MNRVQIAPDKVVDILSRHILTDGYDLTLDMKNSHGSYLYDSKHKRELLDFFTFFASAPIGFNHPKMLNDKEFLDALMRAALTNPSNSDIYTVEYAQFMSIFERVAMNKDFKYAFFIAGGTLAVENTLKAAMDWKVKKNFQKGYRYEKGHQILHFEQAFHGRSGYCLSLTNTSPEKTALFTKFDWPRVINPKIKFPYTDENYEELKKREELAIKQIKQHFYERKDDIAAIIIEPIQAEGGDNHFRAEFLQELKTLALENEALLIFDEVQTGVGLTGKFWAYEHFGVVPDMIAFGKKMQICGLICGERIDEIPDNVFHVPSRINSTWGGNLVDMVRAGKILEIIEEDNLVENAAIVGEHLLQRLYSVAEAYPDKVSNVRGRGLMCAFDLTSRAQRDALIREAMKEGLFLLGCAEKTIRFRPPLNISKEEIDKGVDIIKHVMPRI
ncbi:MAG: L-lysine 6-transaminase [Bacteroidia bacterium]|nr:L-lysine 6-transaminase [Bacteroidia bacterium]MDW8302807.1 L-lysine 6-transaminase [Bacteroidia bacterium]